jgi:hypothetical protein
MQVGALLDGQAAAIGVLQSSGVALHKEQANMILEVATLTRQQRQLAEQSHRDDLASLQAACLNVRAAVQVS